ncbi:MAG TPA: hypothetical protein VMM77_02655 [Gemmatimonadaceae bacterium]|nr:hypothetical protein [Gemmatimonadaceae bacterium]
MIARIWFGIVLVLASFVSRGAAQERVVQRHGFSDGEGRLMAFYSAGLTFSPVAAPRERARGDLALGLELGYLPPLSTEQRRVGDKPEATNLAPIFPRPRISYALTDRVTVEASWIPPIEFFDVKANLASLALSWTAPASGALRFTPRLAGTLGSIEGAITCSEELLSGSIDLAVYYALVCYGRESRDEFFPRHILAEVTVGWDRANAAVEPYAGIGARRDWARFDIGVIRADGSREPDHPILELRALRPYGVLGATVRAAARVRATAEMLYAPGSILTLRLQGTIDAIRR